MKKIYIAILLLFVAKISALGQFTQQRTFSTGSPYTQSMTIEIPGQGFFTATSIPYVINQSSSFPFFQTVISKINYNFDTIWTKKIDSFSVQTLNYDSTSNIIMSGSYLLNNNNFAQLYSILKLSTSGNILTSKSFNLSTINACNQCNAFVNTQDIVIDKNNNLLIKFMAINYLNTINNYNAFLLKIDNNFNFIFSKKSINFLNNGISVYGSFRDLLFFGKLHCFDSSGFYLTGSKYSYNFYNTAQADTASRQICKFDNSGTMLSNKFINEPNNTIDNVLKTNSGIKICGNKNLYSYNQFGQALPSKHFVLILILH